MNNSDHKIYFITKIIYKRFPIFKLNDKYSQIIIENLKFYRNKFQFGLYGFVIMPDHYHIIIDTYENTSIFKIKEDMHKYIAQQIKDELNNTNVKILNKFKIDAPFRNGHKKHTYRILQKGRYDFNIITPEKLVEKLNYIHNNPIRADLIRKAEDYKYSSARNYFFEDHSLIKLDELPI
ncbi:MAG: transposase [bacterium]